jgi:hypothetical protein
MLNYTDLGYTVCTVLEAENINMTGFWVGTSRSIVDKYQTSGENYCLYHSPGLETVV